MSVFLGENDKRKTRGGEMRRSVRLWESRRRFEEKRGLSRSARTSTSSVPHSAAVATLFGNQLPPLGRGEAMAKNKQSIQNSVRIHRFFPPSGSASLPIRRRWSADIPRRPGRSPAPMASMRRRFTAMKTSSELKTTAESMSPTLCCPIPCTRITRSARCSLASTCSAKNRWLLLLRSAKQ